MICFNCKAQIEDGAEFCTECGCRQFGTGAVNGVNLDATQAAPFGAARAFDSNETQAFDNNATQAFGYGATPAASADMAYKAAMGADFGGGEIDLDATQMASFGETQATDYGATQAFDPNATQAFDPNATQAFDPNATQAFDPNATQAFDPNATQALDPNATQAFDPNATQAFDPNATQAFDYGANRGYQPQVFDGVNQNYGYNPPVTPPPQPKKSKKGLIIAIVAAVAVLAVVAGVLAFKLIPELSGDDGDDSDSEKEETTTSASTLVKEDDEEETTTKPEKTTKPAETTAPMPETTTQAVPENSIVVPTVPRGDDTVDIGSLDMFRPTQATDSSPAVRPTKPNVPPVTKVPDAPQSSPSPGYTEPSGGPSSGYVEFPYSIVNTAAKQVHLGAYLYDEDGTTTYGEFGYFYKNNVLCLFMASSEVKVVLETSDTGNPVAYASTGGGAYRQLSLSQKDCLEMQNTIISALVNLGYNRDKFYPDLKYVYLGDANDEDFGLIELYEVYDKNNNYAGFIYVDEETGYYIGARNENDKFVSLMDFIDTTGSKLPLNYK